jgi:hypothetical protein
MNGGFVFMDRDFSNDARAHRYARSSRTVPARRCLSGCRHALSFINCLTTNPDNRFKEVFLIMADKTYAEGLEGVVAGKTTISRVAQTGFTGDTASRIWQGI